MDKVFVLTSLLMLPFTTAYEHHHNPSPTGKHDVDVVCAVPAARAKLSGGWPNEFYIATNGNDSNDGSISAPWATITRAQQEIRCINVSQTSDIYVYFRSGQYFISSTIEFDPSCSGWNNYMVHYAGYPTDLATVGPVILHAGVAVTGWQEIDSNNNIWAATIPSSITDTRQVYINNERMNNTNTGSGIPGSVTITSTGYTTTDPLAWAFLSNQASKDIEFVYTGVGSSWTECRLRVSTVVPLTDSKGQVTGVNITMAEPGFTLGRNRFYGQEVTSPASISNVYGLLSKTTPGQYYFNSNTGTIYYVPRPQDDMSTAEVMVPTIEVLLMLLGDRTAEPAIQPVHHLAFEGLTFQYAGWLEPNLGNGYVDMQSGFRVLPNSTSNDDTWVSVPGNIQFHTVQNVSVINCTFQHLGAVGLEIDDGSQSVLVMNNTFRDLSCGGIYLGQIDDVNMTDPTRINAHVLITNNYFDSIPVEYHDCAALLGGFLENATLSYNTILNNANTGISLGWGWSRDEATNAGWNNIIGNYVYGSNWLLTDGGAIYTLGPQPNSTMGRNYVSNQRHLYGSLYTDEGSAYWHITENVVNNCPEWLHIWTESIHDELVDFCWTNSNYSIVHGTRITIQNITFLRPDDPWPAGAQQVIDESGVSWENGPKP